ncbi:MAG: LacI family transcriptional regulator [Treponema sp.]|jgi:LacI family transcriptional regulator|nr:LacI family transcriptional regulator [Treponema sp.]
MITIKELARLAGVSTTSVSNVIHGKQQKVSAQTRELINTLINEHHYVEKLGLRHLNNARSQIICLTVNPRKLFEHNVCNDPFYGQILSTVERALQGKNYYLMAYNSADVNEIFRTAAAWNIDGLIALAFDRDDCDTLATRTGKPVVSIDGTGGVTENFVNVGLENALGGYLMAQYLINAGYEELWALATAGIGVDQQRFAGCERAFAEARLPFNPDRHVFMSDNPAARIARYEELLPLWTQSTAKKRALFFFSDLYALECLAFLSGRGVHIPDDIAIAGYDDLCCSALSNPPLTTVRQNVPHKAEQAVAQLFRLLDQEAGPARDIRLPVALVIRAST